MLIVTNFQSFPAVWKSGSGVEGRSEFAATREDFFKIRAEAKDETVFLVNCDPRLVLELATSFLLRPKGGTKLISVDLVLRKPRSVADYAALPLKRFLFSRIVDHHIHYFRNLDGLEREFSIGPKRSSFIPFKVNLPIDGQPVCTGKGSYVLCFGRSLRDFDTFFRAVEGLSVPAAIAAPDFALLGEHRARFTRPLNQLPPNVSVLDDDGSPAAQIRLLSDAKIVVLPIVRESLVASGISTCLNAMRLGKCVIASAGPGTNDVFSNEIITVPPEDPAALANAIQKAWDDDRLREETAEAGLAYALKAGGEKDLHQRIIDCVADRVTSLNH